MIYYYFKAADVKWEKTMATIEQIDASSSLYQEDLPAMNQMTFCFWFQGQNEMNDLSYMISIATPGINLLHRLNLRVWFTNIFSNGFYKIYSNTFLPYRDQKHFTIKC